MRAGGSTPRQRCILDAARSAGPDDHLRSSPRFHLAPRDPPCQRAVDNLNRSVVSVRRVRALHSIGVAALAVALSSLYGCLAESPEERLRAAQGEASDGDEEHRPGQPCLACHGADYHPGDEVFVLAGTIYETADDADDSGLEGAEVAFVDALNREFTAATNRVGNFMIQVEPDLGAPWQRSHGRLEIPWEPAFPLTVAVVYRGEDRSMESQIWRDGSCASCHRTAEPGVDHVAKVWHREVSP